MGGSPTFCVKRSLNVERESPALRANSPTVQSRGTSAWSDRSAPATFASARPWSKRGIRVNAVSPGATRTRLGDDDFEKYPEVIAPIVARTALDRLGEASDVGAVIASVLSDEFRWVTGQEIEASGGHRL
jgi:hypothetical protein